MEVLAGKLSEKHKALIFLAGIIMFAACVYLFILLPQQRQINELNASLKDEQQRIQVIEGFMLVHPDGDSYLAELNQQLLQANQMLPNQAGLSEYLIQVEQAAKACGVQLMQIKPLPAVIKNGYQEIQVDIVTHGNFFQSLDFLMKLEAGLRFSSVNHMSIHSQHNVLENKLSVIIYTYGAVSDDNAVSPNI